MPEDLAFRIQLGIILPKMKEKISGDFSKIVEELVGIVKAGTREGEEFSLDPVKEIIMKDIEIFLDDVILPEIEKKVMPSDEKAEEEAKETEEEEETEETEEKAKKA